MIYFESWLTKFCKRHDLKGWCPRFADEHVNGQYQTFLGGPFKGCSTSDLARVTAKFGVSYLSSNYIIFGLTSNFVHPPFNNHIIQPPFIWHWNFSLNKTHIMFISFFHGGENYRRWKMKLLPPPFETFIHI